MSKIILEQMHSRNWFLKDWNGEDLKKKHLSVSKLLGGNDNVRKSRTYCLHGYGGWVTHYQIVDLNKALEAIEDNGFDATCEEYKEVDKK